MVPRTWALVRFVLTPAPMTAIVTVVSTEPHAELVRYLEDAGFTVRAQREVREAEREGILVWLAPPQARVPEGAGEDEELAREVTAWLGAKPKLRVIVVSDRPARLGRAVQDPRGRVILLPAPVFGWQLVDVLREGSAGGP